MTPETRRPAKATLDLKDGGPARPRCLVLAFAMLVFACVLSSVPAHAMTDADAPGSQGTSVATGDYAPATSVSASEQPGLTAAETVKAQSKSEDAAGAGRLVQQADGSFAAVVHARWTDEAGAEIAWPEGTVVTVDLLEDGTVINPDESRKLGYLDGALHTSNEFSAACVKDRDYSVSVRSVSPEPGFAYEVATESAFDEYGQLAFHLTFKKAAEKPAPEEPKVTVTLSATAKLVEYERCELEYVEATFEIAPDWIMGGPRRSPGAIQWMIDGAMGKVTRFNPITFTEEGTYFYKIRQIAGEHAGITYDTSTKLAQVRVVEKAGALEAIVTYGESKGACTESELVITNTYGKPQVSKSMFWHHGSDIDADINRLLRTIDGVSVRTLVKVPQAAERIVIRDPLLEARYISAPSVGSVSVGDLNVRAFKVNMDNPHVGELLSSHFYEQTLEGDDLIAKRYAYPVVEGYEAIAEAAGNLDAQAEASGDTAQLVVDIPDASELRDQWVYVEYLVPLAEGANLEEVATALEVPATLDVYTTDEEGKLAVSTVSVSNVPEVSVPQDELSEGEEAPAQQQEEAQPAPSPKADEGQATKVASSRKSSTVSSLPKTSDADLATHGIVAALAGAGVLLALFGLIRRRVS